MIWARTRAAAVLYELDSDKREGGRHVGELGVNGDNIKMYLIRSRVWNCGVDLTESK